MEIRNLYPLAKQALHELRRIQEGKTNLVKTDRPHIDNTLGGLLPGDIVLLAGASGHGKSTELKRIEDNILNIEINPEASQYVFLNLSLEMKVFNLILRSLDNIIINKNKKEILTEQFTEEEIAIVRKYLESLKDDRRFISQKPTTSSDFYDGAREFLITHQDKKAVFIAVDHIVLMKGSDKKKAVDDTVEAINQLKLEFGNVYFIVLSQMNRGLLDRVDEKNRRSQPSTQDIYMSEFMLQASSYVVVVHNPFKLGINEYSSVNPHTYAYLSNFFGDENKRTGKVSFKTYGAIFFHVLKIREGGVAYDDLFIEEVTNFDREKWVNDSYSEQLKSNKGINMYDFEETEDAEVLPLLTIDDAFETL